MKIHLVSVSLEFLDYAENGIQRVYILNNKFHTLFIKLISTEFNKIFIKTRSYNTIYIFKNYFTIIFLIFNLQL